MNRKLIVLLVITVVVVSISSCSLIDKKEPLPAWIQIDSIRLKDNPNAAEGSLSHDITDAWIFIDEELIGIHEMPTIIPVLEEGKHQVLVGPGVKVSTVSTLRDNYLFYTAYELEQTFQPGETLHIEPTVMYRAPNGNYEYLILEDFEDTFIDVESEGGSQAPIMRTTDPNLTFEGNGSGLVQVNDTVNFAAFRTSGELILPQQGKAVFMEINYYTDYEITIGLFLNNGQARNQSIDYLTLKASESEDFVYKKAYISLTATLAQATNLQYCYVYFDPFINATDAPSDGKILIDNIKILYEL